MKNLFILKMDSLIRLGTNSKALGFLHIDILIRPPSSVNEIACKPGR